MSQLHRHTFRALHDIYLRVSIKPSDKHMNMAIATFCPASCKVYTLQPSNGSESHSAMW